MSNPVVHFEIAVRDGEQGKKYYQELFGWDIKTDERWSYHLIKEEDQGIGGGIFQVEEGRFPPYLTIYIQVDEVQKYLDRAVELGGEQIMPATSFEIGEFALFKDPDGILIGLWKKKG